MDVAQGTRAMGVFAMPEGEQGMSGTKVKRTPRVVDNRTIHINESGLMMLTIAAFNEHLKAVNGTIGGHAG